MRPTHKSVVVSLIVAIFAVVSNARPFARASDVKAGIFMLVIWDGLRPDLMSHQNTPNLFEMAREGVRFEHHHSLYPTLTMVNAAALATGSPPAVSGVLANTMYFAMLASRVPAGSDLAKSISRPQSLENVKLLEQLNGPEAFGGRLLGLDTVAQEIERERGYIAVLGKDGPAFLFDNRVATLAGGHDLLNMPHKDFLFATDALTAAGPDPKAIADMSRPAPSELADPGKHDEFYTSVAAIKAIPAAKAASENGHPALIVLWLRNPDAVQHRAGLGTSESIQALTGCDRELGRIRGAIAQNGIQAQTDLMVVSDHGFATIQTKVDLNGLLVGAGLKKSPDDADIVVAPNSGTDLIYLSRTAFASSESRRQMLQKIVNFVAAQEWCGPIFSSEPAPSSDHRARHIDYRGSIEGTFSAALVGLRHLTRSPDLLISFREYSQLNNAKLTGPGNPAFVLDAHGQHSVPNLSKELIHPVPGVTYADIRTPGFDWSTGMGTHGAAGQRELHNFCAAAGPDFRRHYVDQHPTGNADVAPTIIRVLGLEPNVGPGGAYATGRVIEEALSDGGGSPELARAIKMTTDLGLQGERVVTSLSATQLGKRLYLDDSNVEHVPLGHSP